jgi:hypothetical protein
MRGRSQVRYYLAMNGDIREGFPLQNCAEAWSKHRRYSRLILALFLSWIPFGILTTKVSYVWLHLPVLAPPPSLHIS